MNSPSTSTADEALALARHRVDERFASLVDIDTALLRKPGFHCVSKPTPLSEPWMGYRLYFLAVLPVDTDAVTVVGSPSACAEAEAIDRSDPASVATAIADLAAKQGTSLSYPCSFLVGTPNTLTLSENSSVAEFPAGSPEVIDWNGDVVSRFVDGPIFATFDDQGLTSWAGIKRIRPLAQDMQVATREDARRTGLAHAVASSAIRRLLDEGVTPYYAHISGNEPSAALARSLGFVPYAQVVFAEDRDAL